MLCLPIRIITSLFIPLPTINESRDSTVSIANGYGLDKQDVVVRVPVGPRILFFPMSSRPAPRPTQPPIQRVPGTLSRIVEQPGHETDHSAPTTAEVKETCVYTSTATYAFMT
jgi:hypothetical protein